MDRPAPARPPTCRGRWVVVAALVVGLTGLVAAACGDEGPAAGAGRSGPTTSGPTGSGATSSGAGEGRTNATVVRVVDGDTIVADVDGRQERVRFIGIDTPESVKPRSPVECFGKEASEHTEELLPAGTPVRLVLDVEERDRYGRLLAYVYTADGSFVNLALARDGFAGLLTYPPNVAHVDEFRAAVATARAAGRGLWSTCAGDLPVPSS